MGDIWVPGGSIPQPVPRQDPVWCAGCPAGRPTGPRRSERAGVSQTPMPGAAWGRSGSVGDLSPWQDEASVQCNSGRRGKVWRKSRGPVGRAACDAPTWRHREGGEMRQPFPSRQQGAPQTRPGFWTRGAQQQNSLLLQQELRRFLCGRYLTSDIRTRWRWTYKRSLPFLQGGCDFCKHAILTSGRESRPARYVRCSTNKHSVGGKRMSE